MTTTKIQNNMNKNNQPQELSFYGLSLLSFLKESHPERISDTAFIKTRADLAGETYSQSIKDGLSPNQAEELANEVLYWGLHFSKHDTLVNILWNEFADIVPQSEAKALAIRIQPESEDVFSRYSLMDEFAASDKYDSMYTALTGCIDLWLEENEL